jgi:tetratricopeptide (TPR) repeat protein
LHLRPGAKNQLDRDPIMAATMCAFLLTKFHRHDEAAAVLDQARDLETKHPNLDLLHAVLCELRFLAEPSSLEPLEEAERALENCLASGDDVFLSPLLPGATSWTAATRLGTVKLLLGKPQDAARAFERALDTAPDHREAQLGACEAQIRNGQSDEAIKRLEALLSTPDADAWFLIAEAADALGAKDDARLFASTAARTLQQESFVACHRRLQITTLKRILAA